MNISETKLQGCKIIEPKVFQDSRGFFLETFQVKRYKDLVGIDLEFVQDNCSRSKQGTLRGLHYQKKKPQGKLVRVIRGNILDVALDIRAESITYGHWVSIELNDTNKKQLWVPPGFAHGFVVLSEEADVEYKCTDYYDPLDEHSILWSDPMLNINWPSNIEIITSEKDTLAKPFNELEVQ